LESTKGLHASLTVGARSSSKIGQRRWRSREIGAREVPPPPGEKKRARVGRVGKKERREITAGGLKYRSKN